MQKYFTKCGKTLSLANTEKILHFNFPIFAEMNKINIKPHNLS